MSIFQNPTGIASRLEANANAVLEFDVSDGSTSTDDFGNPIPNLSPTKESYTCIIRDKDLSSRADIQEFGADKKVLEIKGLLVEPKSFSAIVGHLSEGFLTITNPDGKVRSGAVTIKFHANNPMARNYIGMQFNGIWREELTEPAI